MPRSGRGLGQAFFILCYISCWFYVNFCSYDSLVIYVFYDIYIVVSLSCLYAICGMLYYVSKFLIFLLYRSCLHLSHWVLLVHKLSIVGRLVTLK